MKTLTVLLVLCAALTECSAKAGKGGAHVSSIYINTPDSSVKASVTDQPGKSIQTGRTYHWYASNQLCVTNGAYSGRLLHGLYSSFYPNHFLLSQGQFCSGLKDGCWKRWLPDGSLHEVIHYKNGQLHGTYELYSSSGYLMQRIYYRKGARAGKTTIFSQDGNDSVIVYKNGAPKETKDARRKKSRLDSGRDDKKNKSDSVKKKGRLDSARDDKKNKSDSVKKPGDKRRETEVKRSDKKKESSPADSTGHFRDWILSGKKIFLKKDSANISTPPDVKNKKQFNGPRHFAPPSPYSRSE